MDETNRYGGEWGLPQEEHKMMVLLVDDQALVGEAVRRALLNEPHIDFHFTPNAHEAVALAETTRPTVILQDLVMPGVDGLTLVRQYRANLETCNIPVIVLSSSDDPAIKSAAFAAGANDYVVKLPDAIELIARVRYHSYAYIHLLERNAAYRALRESQKKLQESNLELQRLTVMDGMTGVANRRHFDDYVEAEWKRAKRERTELALLMVDVDHFKLYNDTYGHVAGDRALQTIAATITAHSKRPADLVARFGGEEFAIVLPSTSDSGARVLGEQVRRGVEDLAIPHEASKDKILTVSVGAAAVVPEEGRAVTWLIEAADRSLYRAKSGGRNRVSGPE